MLLLTGLTWTCLQLTVVSSTHTLSLTHTHKLSLSHTLSYTHTHSEALKPKTRRACVQFGNALFAVVEGSASIVFQHFQVMHSVCPLSLSHPFAVNTSFCTSCHVHTTTTSHAKQKCSQRLAFRSGHERYCHGHKNTHAYRRQVSF